MSKPTLFPFFQKCFKGVSRGGPGSPLFHQLDNLKSLKTQLFRSGDDDDDVGDDVADGDDGDDGAGDGGGGGRPGPGACGRRSCRCGG